MHVINHTTGIFLMTKAAAAFLLEHIRPSLKNLELANLSSLELCQKICNTQDVDILEIASHLKHLSSFGPGQQQGDKF